MRIPIAVGVVLLTAALVGGGAGPVMADGSGAPCDGPTCPEEGDPAEAPGLDDVDIESGDRVTKLPVRLDWNERWFARAGRDRTALAVVAYPERGEPRLLDVQVARGDEARDETVTLVLRGDDHDAVRRANRLVVTASQSFDSARDRDDLYERSLVDSEVLRDAQRSTQDVSGRMRDCLLRVWEFQPGGDMDYCRMPVGAWLPDSNVRGLRFYSGETRLVNLSGSDLRGARMAGSTLESTRLDGARLDDAVLRGARIGPFSVLINTSLQRAVLEASRIQLTSMAGADLSGADLDRWSLSGVALGGTTWSDGGRCAWYAIDGCPR